ncbi:sensor domain-containing protein [Halolamina salina]|uniref:Sensor domain-containing protein n=2 Tax=Halolamina salina TaxID=1220023 RepID=A0ABD6B6G8_9EURY
MPSPTALPARDGRLRSFLAAPVRPQTYLNLAFGVLAFPLGLVYLVSVTVGLGLGVGLSVVLVGLPLLAAVVAGSLVAAAFERRLTAWLLGVDVPPGPAPAGDGRWERLRALATEPGTYAPLLYLPLKFVAGAVALVVVMNALVTGVALLSVPLHYGEPGLYVGLVTDRPVELHPALHFGWNRLLVGFEAVVTIEAWRIRTLPGALVVAGVGALLLLVGLAFTNWLAGAYGRLTARLLARTYDPVSLLGDD